jgi:hypothetical protein
MPKVTVTLIATTMEGEDLQDPSIKIEIREMMAGTDNVLATVTLNDFDGSATFAVELEEAEQPVWQMTADFSLYDAGHAFSFFPATNSNPTWTAQAARLPNKWTPDFTLLADLASPRFDALKTRLAVSNSVDLKNGDVIGDLQANYDTLASAAAVLAKAALLNLYAVLIEEVDPEQTTIQGKDIPWFSYVQKIVRLDQERFVAEVNPGLFESVSDILNGLGGKYAGQGYSTDPPADFILHYPNIPAQYGGNGLKRPVSLVQMITLKKRYRQGDVQLTVSFFRFPDGNTVHLLDCDMDEHENIVGHSFDLLTHLIENSGTNPIYMHEFIEADSAQNNDGIATIDLGYTLKSLA